MEFKSDVRISQKYMLRGSTLVNLIIFKKTQIVQLNKLVNKQAKNTLYISLT